MLHPPSHMSLADFCGMCALTICQQKEGECLLQQAVSAASHRAAPLSTRILHEPSSDALIFACRERAGARRGTPAESGTTSERHLLHLKGAAPESGREGAQPLIRTGPLFRSAQTDSLTRTITRRPPPPRRRHADS